MLLTGFPCGIRPLARLHDSAAFAFHKPSFWVIWYSPGCSGKTEFSLRSPSNAQLASNQDHEFLGSFLYSPVLRWVSKSPSLMCGSRFLFRDEFIGFESRV